YLAKLTPDAEDLDFATYYINSNHVDGGTSRFDKAGIVYQAVCSCEPVNVMETLANAYSQVNSPNCSIGVFKIDFEIETITAAAFASPSTSGCLPLTIDFQYTGSDAETFFWDFGTGDTSTEENPTYTFTEEGTYQVMQVVNAPNTCNAIDTFYLQIDVLNNSSTLTDTVFCPGDVNLFLDASVANATYLWQDGTSGATYQVNDPGIYWVDVSVTGCVRRDSFLVDSSSEIEIDLGNDQSFCDVPSFELDASNTLAATYQWSTGESTSTISTTNSGQYTVTLFDDVGCFVSDTIELMFTNTPLIDLGPDQTLCEGDEWLLDVTTAGATYSWQDGSTDAQFNITETGTYVVEVNLNGCVATDEFLAVFSPPLPLDLGDDQSACDVQSLFLDASTTGAASYEWSSGSTNPILEVQNTGDYFVTITNDLGCETIDNITITFSLTPEITLAADTSLCDGESLNLIPTFVTSGVSYSWQDGSTTNQYSVNAEGLYWALADVDGCVDSDSIYISFTSLPIVNYEITNVDCYEDSTGALTPINPTSVNNFEFTWSNGVTTGDQLSIPSGNYQVTITDENDCIFVDDFTVTEPEPLTFVVNNENVSCFGDANGSITIDSIAGGTPPYLYSLNADTLLPNTIFNNLDGGDYEVSTVDANDCETSIDVFVYEPAETFLSAGEDKTIDLGDSVKIDGFAFPEINQIVNWTSEEYVNCLNCIQPFGQPLRTADFVVTSVDSITGCTLRDTMRINVEKPRNIYIPNAFSPNGDGNNDIFFPFGDISARRFTYFRVFDRWGELVHEANDFELNDPRGGWDGRLKGEFMNPGVFAYILEVEFVDGVVKRYKGDVTLMR
ncbi:MAG: gliding motility-associated C-terminal domain-containing protein, partial [Saprospiraceae bacterium]